MDPGRWSNHDMTELERQLLDAARGDRVPDALRARMAEALQVGGTTVAGGATAAKVGAPLFAKAGLWGALSLGLVAAGGWYATQSTPVEEASAETPTRPELPAALEAPSENTPVPTDPAAAEPAPGAHEAAPNPAPVVAVDDDALRAEVALLARVRQALQQKATARSLRLLEEHQRRFASGTLVPEATALRVEALMQQGAHEEARAQAAQFLKTYPAHPLRAHVTSLVQAQVASADVP